MLDKIHAGLYEQARRVSFITGTRINIRIPSVLSKGEKFKAMICVTDASGLPADNFSGDIVFSDSPGIAGLPGVLEFVPGRPSACIDGLEACDRTDVAVVNAHVRNRAADEFQAGITSNPAWIFESPDYRIFWGDLHFHTRYSNCSAWRCLDPEWGYAYAMDAAFLDFAAAADHLRGISEEPGRWKNLCRLARRYNMPGRFVSFLAFESSHAKGFGGDNNIYFLDDDAEYFWLDRDDMRGTAPRVPLEEVWRQLDARGKPYFSVPHHTGRAGKYRAWDEQCYSPEHEPLFEIYSGWGSSEIRNSRYPVAGGNNDARSYFTDALKAGARFGVIASSDDHATLPGGVHPFLTNPFRQPLLQGYPHKGLAAVRAPELTRENLFGAMRGRSTYATTDSRTLIDVNIGGAGMGREIPACKSLRNSRTINVRYTSDNASSASLTLLRNGEPIAGQVLKGPDIATEVKNVCFRDESGLEVSAVRDSLFSPEPFVAYYLRVSDNTGASQWTSPIWIILDR